VTGYDSFWSTCTREKVKGFNGVATYAREGLTLAADPAPLGDPAYDCEGRAVLTDHGRFIIINVYVPNSGPGSVRLPFKLRFLAALRRRMQAERARGKAVVLLGDLNMSYRPQDYHRKWRSLQLDQLLARAASVPTGFLEGTSAGTDGTPLPYDFLPCSHCGEIGGSRRSPGDEGGLNACHCPRCRATGECRFCGGLNTQKQYVDTQPAQYGASARQQLMAQRTHTLVLQLQGKWQRLCDILSTRRVVAKTVKSTTSKTGQQEKFRVSITVPGKGEVPLGSLSESSARAEREYSMEARTVTDEDGTEYPLHPAYSMCVGDLAELVDKALGIPWSEADERLMASLSGYCSRCVCVCMRTCVFMCVHVCMCVYSSVWLCLCFCLCVRV